METVVAYTRVSTEEQADSRAGLDAQRRAIMEEAARRGWTVVDVIEDAGFSGKDMKRPGIAVAMEMLRTHKAATLVVAKLDRLSRSMLDFSTLMATATRQRWCVVALDLGVDTTTASGEMMANVLCTFAQFERRLISDRTKAALAERRLDPNVRLGRPRMVDDATRLSIIESRKAGATFQSIADTLNERGVKPVAGGRRWYPATVRRMALSEAPTSAGA
jgi:DNA invertase Pin-like site-specific DNA recombinase